LTNIRDNRNAIGVEVFASDVQEIKSLIAGKAHGNASEISATSL
jgi:hypothetical protein